jgi:hypothetical protein
MLIPPLQPVAERRLVDQSWQRLVSTLHDIVVVASFFRWLSVQAVAGSRSIRSPASGRAYEA